jgi:hypothetical protein
MKLDWLICLKEIYSKVRISKFVSDSFLIPNGLKQGDNLSSLFFNFASEYAIRKVQKKSGGLKLNVIYQFLVYADNVNVLGGNTNTIRKNTAALSEASGEGGLEVNTEKSQYIVMSRHQNAWVYIVHISAGYTYNKSHAIFKF